MENNFKHKNILVCGMMRSGQSAALLLNELGADVTAQDLKPAEKIEWHIPYGEKGIKPYLGRNPDEIVGDFDLIVISPGIPQGLPFLEKAGALGVPVWGEIELASRLCPCPIVAITGTNGKTTTTALVGEILRKNGKQAAVVGNIGEPFCKRVKELSAEHMAVAEISSFQLETVHTFKPFISVILNITPDHLNRHRTMENYSAVKERIFKNQRAGDYAVLNYDDPYCRRMTPACETVWFSAKEKLPDGVYLCGETIKTGENFNRAAKRSNGKAVQAGAVSIDLAGVRILTEDALAAVTAGLLAGVPPKSIEETLRSFKSLEHRIEYVATVGGAEYFNDSKATNTDSAIKGLEAMKAPVVLIGGGSDKQVDFGDWVRMFEGKVKRLIVMGETAGQITETCRAYNFTAFERVNSLRDAVSLAYARAESGDCVLLSPACASFDMFDNFEQRGEMFKKFVRELA